MARATSGPKAVMPEPIVVAGTVDQLPRSVPLKVASAMPTPSTATQASGVDDPRLTTTELTGPSCHPVPVSGAQLWPPSVDSYKFPALPGPWVPTRTTLELNQTMLEMSWPVKVP